MNGNAAGNGADRPRTLYTKDRRKGVSLLLFVVAFSWIHGSAANLTPLARARSTDAVAGLPKRRLAPVGMAVPSFPTRLPSAGYLPCLTAWFAGRLIGRGRTCHLCSRAIPFGTSSCDEPPAPRWEDFPRSEREPLSFHRGSLQRPVAYGLRSSMNGFVH